MSNEFQPQIYEDATSKLDSAVNLHHSNYWGWIPDLLGSDYADAAHRNNVQLEVLQTALREERGAVVNGRTLGRSRTASEFYHKLGTHNSLYGARGDLMLAARSVCSSDEAAPLTATEVIDKLRGDDSGIPDRTKLLAMQMLIDVVRDPSPNTSEVSDATATPLILLRVVKEGSDKVASRLTHQAMAKKKMDKELTTAERQTLSQAIRFNSEARFMYLQRIPDKQWEVDLGRMQGKILKSQEKSGSRSGGSARLSPQEQRIKSMNGIEDLKTYVFLNETARQVEELEEVAFCMDNGSLTEQYFNLLMRHTLLTTEDDTQTIISATTARQDCPHDGLTPEGKLPRLSHDTVVESPNGKTLFIQLKAGGKPANYHSGVTVIDIYNSDSNMDMSNLKIHQEAIAGLHQLRGALEEAITGTFYDGDLSVLEKHIKTTKDKLSIFEKKQLVDQPA